MDFLTGLHGSLATILLCALLFVDEAGVPMPIAPNEVLLVVAGLLIASGSLAWFIIYPLAIAAILLGAFCGYSWARAVGPDQLRAVAVKVHAERPYDRARKRIAQASVRHIAVSRCIPGMRVYVTLVAGASEVPLSTFMRASVPAAIVWTTAVMGVGLIVGAPAAHFFTAIEKVAFSGAILVVLGLLAYRAARKAPKELHPTAPFAGIAPLHRVVLAFALDAGIVTVIAAGVDRITRYVLELRVANFPEVIPKGWDFAALIGAMAIFYVATLRRGLTGETAGEAVFDVSYVHPHRHPHPRAQPPGEDAA